MLSSGVGIEKDQLVLATNDCGGQIAELRYPTLDSVKFEKDTILVQPYTNKEQLNLRISLYNQMTGSG